MFGSFFQSDILQHLQLQIHSRISIAVVSEQCTLSGIQTILNTEVNGRCPERCCDAADIDGNVLIEKIVLRICQFADSTDPVNI